MTAHTIYKHLDRDGATLYVGCTSDLEKRTHDHGTTASWWPRVASVRTVAHVSTREVGRQLERDLIAALQPPFNQVHTGHSLPAGPPHVKPLGVVCTVDAPVTWVLMRTSETQHAMRERGQTVCGMNTEWRRVYPVGDEDWFPRCQLCVRKAAS